MADEFDFDDFYGDVQSELDKADVIMKDGPVVDTIESSSPAIDGEPVLEYDFPDEVEPVEMTEEVVDALIERLEGKGFLEGVDFLVENDGKFLCNGKINTSELVSEGLTCGDLF